MRPGPGRPGPHREPDVSGASGPEVSSGQPGPSRVTKRPNSPHDPILLLGRNGQIGWELQRTLASLGPLAALGRAEVDLADPDRIRQAVRDVTPCLIVNAAAYTAVDKAEEEAELAMAVNGHAPGVLAEEAKRLGVPLIHFSTDYVFDGSAAPDGSRRPYTESDPTNPLNIYGKTKLAGEQAIGAVGPAHLILRTSWIYATRGRNFLLTIQRLAGEGKELRVVDDQIGSPTWARTVAEATAAVLERSWLGKGSAALAERGGLYHLSAAGQTSWCGFARAILESTSGSRENRRPPPVHPISSGEFPSPARRLPYSVLDNAAISATFGVILPDWKFQLETSLDNS